MQLNFTKMHGLGNDFMVVDGVRQDVRLSPGQVRALADRHTGVGFDQLLLVEKARGNADFRYRIYNADGGEVEQCGNGARCLARFVHDSGLSDRQRLVVETLGGEMSLQLMPDASVTVDVGAPRLDPADIPLQAGQRQLRYSLDVKGDTFEIGALSMGNPHAVMLVEDVETAPVQTLGPLIEAHERFPQRVNIGFMQVVSREHVRLRVYERGAGETRACGSGACAAMVAGRLWGLLDARVTVSLPGGDLVVEWSEEGEAVLLNGPATRVYEGHVEL